MRNIIKSFSILFLIVLLNYQVFAKPVDIISAGTVAKNCFYERANRISKVDYNNINIRESFTIQDSQDPVYYIFNINDRGFVIVSAEDNVYPIIGYSLENNYISKNQPDNFRFWMEHYRDEILATRKLKLASNNDIDLSWKHLMTKPDLSANASKTVIVAPLLTCTWDQGQYYNALCPADAAGPSGHDYTGCVATSMAQVMFYYRWPQTGVGTHTSHSQTYGNLTVNPGATTYDWNNMPDNLISPNTQVATLMYHAGVTVNMSYSSTGSAASMHSAASAMNQHFRYGAITDNNRSNFTTTAWINLLATELDANRPVLYAGDDTVSGGHAFVCDGYDSNNNFHFNWGWSGYYNGYFTLADLNPSTDHFNFNQEALTNIYPSGTYPPNCTGTTTITTSEGTLEDGSGSSDYQNNNDCRWLIAPPNASTIRIYFSAFSTENNNDQFIVYDGATTADSVLGVFSGNSVPNPVVSTGGQMLIRFLTNSSVTSSGWHIYYKATIPPMCNALTNLTAPSGTFSDGSGTSNYAFSTYCDWLINIPGASSITIGFTSFSLATGDRVRLYDVAQSPSVLLANLTGTTIPSTATYNTSQLAVLFTSTSTGSGPGWSAFYSSVVTGIEGKNIDNSLSIFPNPAKNVLNYDFNSNNGNADITITTLLGQEVYRNIISGTSGKFNGKIDISGFTPGVYFVRILTGNETVTRKIVIQ